MKAVGTYGEFGGAEGVPWDGTDRTVVFLVAVSFHQAFRRRFQDMLKVRPSSLLMLGACFSSSRASL